ncbi:MAG TPA: GNAT family N-acetyltransferase [Bacteroidia bacterium]|nr:GNAT family N-acetyltransferase [Bacteroidia bacterium]
MINFKLATENDFSTIEKLARIIWDKHYITIISQQQIDFMLNKMYSFEALKKQMEEGHKLYLVVNDNSEAIGFISVSTDNDRNFWLHKFYILQQKQHTGIGTLVFNKVFKELYEPKSIRLNVNRQNFKSINFYFKLGFKIEKVNDLEVGNGYFMNDFVMLWQNKN